jgi:hypothetical protein
MVGVVVGLAALPGCVTRKMLIRSEPSGLRTLVDRTEVGRTPVEVPFEYYGDREIVILPEAATPEGPHFSTLRTVARVRPPWWERVPFDFVADVLLPFPLEDVHVLDYRLEPAPTDETADELLEHESAGRRLADRIR